MEDKNHQDQDRLKVETNNDVKVVVVSECVIDMSDAQTDQRVDGSTDQQVDMEIKDDTNQASSSTLTDHTIDQELDSISPQRVRTRSTFKQPIRASGSDNESSVRPARSNRSATTKSTLGVRTKRKRDKFLSKRARQIISREEINKKFKENAGKRLKISQKKFSGFSVHGKNQDFVLPQEIFSAPTVNAPNYLQPFVQLSRVNQSDPVSGQSSPSGHRSSPDVPDSTFADDSDSETPPAVIRDSCAFTFELPQHLENPIKSEQSSSVRPDPIVRPDSSSDIPETPSPRNVRPSVPSSPRFKFSVSATSAAIPIAQATVSTNSPTLSPS